MKLLHITLYIIVGISLAAIVTTDSVSARYLCAAVIAGVVIVQAFIYFPKTRKNSPDPVNPASNHGHGLDTHNELLLLFELLESAVKEDLVVVKQELNQVKGLVNNAVKELTDSFYQVSSGSEEQKKLFSEILNRNEKPQQVELELSRTSKLIKDACADAIRTLQFEDIVIQVSDNSIQYIDNLDEFFNEFKQQLSNRLDRSASPEDVKQQLHMYVELIKNIRKERQLPDRKAVHQNDLAEGGVELF